MIAVIRDLEDGRFVVSFHDEDGLPAHSRHTFDSLDAALSAYRELAWATPNNDADYDVVGVAWF